MTQPRTHRRFRAIRAAWAQRLPVTCPRCGRPVHPGQPWDLGHAVALADRPDLALDPTNLRPEHAACNRAAGAGQTNRARAGRRRRFGW